MCLERGRGPLSLEHISLDTPWVEVYPYTHTLPCGSHFRDAGCKGSAGDHVATSFPPSTRMYCRVRIVELSARGDSAPSLAFGLVDIAFSAILAFAGLVCIVCGTFMVVQCPRCRLEAGRGVREPHRLGWSALV